MIELLERFTFVESLVGWYLMKYSVYVLKCEHEKFYVGFSTRELDKGPKLSRIYKPLNIMSIGTFENIEEAKNKCNDCLKREKCKLEAQGFLDLCKELNKINLSISVS